MRSSLKFIIAAVLLVALIAVAVLLYNKLSDDYKPDTLETISTTTATTTESTASTADVTTSGSEEKPTFSANDFTVLDKDGNSVKLSDFAGKPIVLNFWATWCYYCKEEMPDFNEAYKKYPDVQFVMVNATDGVSETVESAKAFIEQNGYDFDVFFDTKSEAVSAYYVTAFPMTYFINANGELVARGNGMLDLESLEEGIGMITK